MRWPRSGPRTVGGVQWYSTYFMGQTSQDKAYEVVKHSLTRSLGIAGVRANARMRLRVLSRVSMGGKSVPVGGARDENKHFFSLFHFTENSKVPYSVRIIRTVFSRPGCYLLLPYCTGGSVTGAGYGYPDTPFRLLRPILIFLESPARLSLF